MEVSPSRWNKTHFFASSGPIDTAIWMHYMDAHKTYGEKAWQQFYKNAVRCIEQVLEATTYKAAAVRPPTIYHKKLSKLDEPDKRNKDEHISDVLLKTPSHGRAKVGPPARTYKQQLCVDTWCSLDDLPGAMDDRDGWRERGREIHASSKTCWWWWYIYVYI